MKHVPGLDTDYTMITASAARANFHCLQGTALLVGSTLALFGCGGSEPKGEITQVAPAAKEDTAKPPAMTTKERLRVRDMVPTGGSPHGAENPHAGEDPHAGENPHAHGDMPAAEAAPAYTYTLPEGWQEQPTTSMRAVNLKVSEASECYLTALGGSGGGLASNLNRWRKQMGQPDLSDAEIAALPKRALLGGEASLISIDGTFSGMGNIEPKAGYRMLGLALVSDAQSIFIKLTGPQAEIEAQAANFDAFCASLKANAADAPAAAPAPAPTSAPEPAAAPAAATPMPQVTPPAGAAGGGFDTTKLQWSAPPSWQRGADRMMRVVTYTVGQSECYITVLDGPAGGVEANLNRWRGQMDQPALTAEEFAALPKLSILGKEALLIEAKGNFTTMDGKQLSNQMLAGAICLLDSGLLTVKMTGPEAEVAAELENFKAFCGSITLN